MPSKRYDKTKLLKIFSIYIMVRRTRIKGGMINLVTTVSRPIGRAAVTLGKEYSKDYMQKVTKSNKRSI